MQKINDRPLHRPTPRSRSPFGGRSTLLVAAGVLAASCVALASSDRIESVRTMIEKWVETRRQISEERLDWARKRETLRDRIDVVSREIASIDARMAETRQKIADAGASGAGLKEQSERLAETSRELVDLVTGLETRTRELLTRVPEPIRERVKPFSQRLPADPANPRLSLSERFQSVVAILNDLNKSAGEIITTSEIRNLPDGRSAEVTTLYLGISKGYYIDGTGTIAGVGWGGPDGWIWQPANDSAGEIARAIAMLSKGQEADFVRIPVQIP